MRIQFTPCGPRGERMAEIFGKGSDSYTSPEYPSLRHEDSLIDKVAHFLRLKGWEVTTDFLWACIPVRDREEFENLVDDYKAAKKQALKH